MTRRNSGFVVHTGGVAVLGVISEPRNASFRVCGFCQDRLSPCASHSASTTVAFAVGHAVLLAGRLLPCRGTPAVSNRFFPADRHTIQQWTGRLACAGR